MYAVARQRLERERGDKFGSRLGHHHAHLGSGLNEESSKLGTFISRNTAGNAQEYAFIRKAQHDDSNEATAPSGLLRSAAQACGEPRQTSALSQAHYASAQRKVA